MTTVALLNQRYRAVADLTRNGLEIISVGDPTGAAFNSTVRSLLRVASDDGHGLWDDLIGAAKSLRWKMLAHPAPIAVNPALPEAVAKVIDQCRRLRGAVADLGLIDELRMSAEAVAVSDPPVGCLLLESIEEVVVENCVVVAMNGAAQAAMHEWLAPHGALVLTPGDLERRQPDREVTYAVGPPRFFRSSLVTAPVTGELGFLLPEWFRDRTVPASAIAEYAEGAIRIRPRHFTSGVQAAPDGGRVDGEESAVEDDLLPEPVWGERKTATRPPGVDEVEARKVLLAGGFAMWLDDGERIRTLEPRQPARERVTYTEVSSVRPGTYLLLRIGAGERGALYESALRELGSAADGIAETQAAWKCALARRLDDLGKGEVVRRLSKLGVKASEQARAWTDPSFVRPNRDEDMRLTLRWLGVSAEPTLGNATKLRHAVHKANAAVRRGLEAAVAAADLSGLESTGHLQLALTTSEGARPIVATKILAIAPFKEIQMRHDARVPFEDAGAQWLE
ncbi:hypothetical protein JOE63_002857 [Cellulosimicrobium cellulans]|uniref:hypothetical protein n=1 Tax=Cellulosimicrobium cellulans TaxID=1710 RepID=UPI00195B5892|nr:hypothetical protein [Cellulosimicrobium cellulans]MBM7820380.1 hypothetical protein [Cellulosimicrobium cellulans]